MKLKTNKTLTKEPRKKNQKSKGTELKKMTNYNSRTKLKIPKTFII
jgi:hypothetical protein